jgi:acyl-CoA thioesterase
MTDHSASDAERGRRIVAGMLERDAFSRWLGVEMVSCEAGRCTLRMTVRAEMLNGFGVSHGGIVFSFADSAMAFAANSGEQVTVAVDNGITYPAAVRDADELTAVAEQETASAKLGYYRVVVRRQDDAVVALFRGTVYRTKQLHLRTRDHD